MRTRPAARRQLALIAAAAAVVFGCRTFQAAEVIDRLLASVAGQLIMASDVAVARHLGLAPRTATDREVLDRLIDRALVLAEVERYAPPEPSADEIAAEQSRVRAGFDDQAAYDRALEHAGFDADMIRERIRQTLRIEAYLAQRFAVAPPTSQEIDDAWRMAPERFNADRPTTLEEARPVIVRALVEQRRAPRVAEWLAGLRRRTRIVVPSGDGNPQVSE